MEYKNENAKPKSRWWKIAAIAMAPILVASMVTIGIQTSKSRVTYPEYATVDYDLFTSPYDTSTKVAYADVKEASSSEGVAANEINFAFSGKEGAKVTKSSACSQWQGGIHIEAGGYFELSIPSPSSAYYPYDIVVRARAPYEYDAAATPKFSGKSSALSLGSAGAMLLPATSGQSVPETVVQDFYVNGSDLVKFSCGDAGATVQRVTVTWRKK